MKSLEQQRITCKFKNVSGVSERVNGGKCIEATFKFVFSTIKGRHWSLAQRN